MRLTITLLKLLLFFHPIFTYAVKYTPNARNKIKCFISDIGIEKLKTYNNITILEGENNISDTKAYTLKKISSHDSRVNLRGKFGTFATKQFQKGEIIGPYLGVWMYTGLSNLSKKEDAIESIIRLEHDTTFTQKNRQCCSDYQFDFPWTNYPISLFPEDISAMHHVNSSLPEDGNTSNATFGLAYNNTNQTFTPYYVATKRIKKNEEILGNYLDPRISSTDTEKFHLGTDGYINREIESPSNHLKSNKKKIKKINAIHNFTKSEIDEYKSSIQ